MGWMSVQTTQMRDHKYFGNLRVSTLLDGMALSGVMQGTISLVSSRLVSEGEDLLVSNPVCACKVRRLTDPDRRSTARWQRVAWFGRRLLQCALNWRAALASRTSSICLTRTFIVAQPCSG